MERRRRAGRSCHAMQRRTGAARRTFTEISRVRTCFSRQPTYGGTAVISPTDLLAEPDAVLLDLQADSGEAAVRALHERLAEASNAVMDAPKLLADVTARMRLGSVCVADNVAMPHARTSAVDRVVVGVGRSARGVRFDPAHPRVELVFLIATPKDAVTEYLQTVAAFARILRNAAKRAALFTTPDEESFRGLLAGGVVARQ